MGKLGVILLVVVFVWLAIQSRQANEEQAQKEAACAAQGGKLRGDYCTKFEAPK